MLRILSCSLGFAQHLFGVIAGGFGDFHATQHARQLFHSGGFVQPLNAGVGGVVPLNFVYLPVLMPLAGNLWLVGNAQHLGVLAQLAQ